MALQSTGAISLNDVQTEFGGSNPIGINEYYRGGSNVPDTPANSSIPTSGTIAMDDFYGGDNTPAGPPATLEYNWSHYAYGSNMGTIILYWLNDATGTLNQLRSITGQQHTAALQPWDDYTEDLSPYAGQTGRIVYRYQGGGGFRGDAQIDNMELINGAVTVDLDPTVGRTDGLWQQQTRGTSTYSSTSFSNMVTSSSTTYGWQYDAGGTPSSGTGNSQDADGGVTFVAYVETSGTNGNTTSYHWLRSTSTYTLASSGSPPPPPPPSATYAFTSTPSSINEGSSSAFTVGTTNVPNSTVLYWTTQHVTSQAADFSANSGNFTINSGSGTFTVSIATDTLTEATQYFRIQVRTGSSSGPVVATSNQVSINNISGYTWTTTSFSPNSKLTESAGEATYPSGGGWFFGNNVTVGSGNQTFPFTYTITDQGNAPSPVLQVLRNNSIIINQTLTSSTGTFTVTTSSTSNQIKFQTFVYDDRYAPNTVLKVFSNGTTQVWQHTHYHDYYAGDVS